MQYSTLTRIRYGLKRFLWPIALALLVSSCVTQSQSFRTTDRIADLSELLADGNLEQAAFLVDRHRGTLSNNLALDISIREGNLAAVQHFIPLARVNKPIDLDGVTPLIRAVKDAPDGVREKIIRALLDAGADPALNDNFGRSAANYASNGGDYALADFLESEGNIFYSSQPAQRTVWLPQVDIEQGLNGKKPASKSALYSRSPLSRSGTGRPDLLFASAWVPQTKSGDVNPYAGLRFHADGSGDVVQFTPKNKRLSNRPNSHLAWDYHRDSLYFMVLTNNYASYCQSVAGAPGRFGINCTDYAAAGGNIAAALKTEVTPDAAKQLLNDPTARARLEEVGETISVLETADQLSCKPKRASKAQRTGKSKRAANKSRAGDWVVFDAKRFKTFSAERELVCTQRESRRAAFDNCKAAGSRCRSVGGCGLGEATAVASVFGHDWAWIGCNADVEFAKRKALEQCRRQAGCDCQVVYTSLEAPQGPPEVCRPKRRRS